MIPNLMKTAAVDLVGLGLWGAAIYGFITGKLTEGALITVTGLAGTYLGLKIPTAPGQP